MATIVRMITAKKSKIAKRTCSGIFEIKKPIKPIATKPTSRLSIGTNVKL